MYKSTINNKQLLTALKRIQELRLKTRKKYKDCTLELFFKPNELREDSVHAKFAHTADDGKAHLNQFYNLAAIISVSYHSTQHQIIP